jgi:two-component system, NtrC family, sensor kinase
MEEIMVTSFQSNTKLTDSTVNSTHLTLPPQLFAQAFPFHLVFNRDREIVQVGEVLERINPKALVGTQLEQHFRICRPSILVDFNLIHKRSKSIFLLESLHNEMQLKGQMMYVESLELMFFLGSLWVTDTTELAPIGVHLKDFAIHDPIVDFLFLLQARNVALADAQKLAAELTQQKEQLQEALQVKAQLAEIAEAQAQKLEQTLKELHQTQAQLIHTEKMSSLGQMVAGIAHEINNPTNFIHGNLAFAKEYIQDLLKLLQLYQQQHPNPSVEIQKDLAAIDLEFLKQDLTKIFKSMEVGTERISHIVKSLRIFSRIDEAEFKKVDIHKGIESTLMILDHRLKFQSHRPAIKVIKEYGELPLVECYAGQLNQVFMNLLTNAIDALEESHGSWVMSEKKESSNYSLPITHCPLPIIRICTEVVNNNWVAIRIADNGIDITEDVRSKLFDPFFTTKPVGQGTGLGLFTSYQIVVEKHGGKLRFDSAPGQGAEFIIEIPIRQAVLTRKMGHKPHLS